MYVKVTDGGNIRFYNLSDDASKHEYNVAIKNETGCVVVCNEDGTAKEYDEAQVVSILDKAKNANNIHEKKEVVRASRRVVDTDAE